MHPESGIYRVLTPSSERVTLSLSMFMPWFISGCNYVINTSFKYWHLNPDKASVFFESESSLSDCLILIRQMEKISVSILSHPRRQVAVILGAAGDHSTE